MSCCALPASASVFLDRLAVWGEAAKERIARLQAQLTSKTSVPPPSLPGLLQGVCRVSVCVCAKFGACMWQEHRPSQAKAVPLLLETWLARPIMLHRVRVDSFHVPPRGVSFDSAWRMDATSPTTTETSNASTLEPPKQAEARAKITPTRAPPKVTTKAPVPKPEVPEKTKPTTSESQDKQTQLNTPSTVPSPSAKPDASPGGDSHSSTPPPSVSPHRVSSPGSGTSPKGFEPLKPVPNQKFDKVYHQSLGFFYVASLLQSWLLYPSLPQNSALIVYIYVSTARKPFREPGERSLPHIGIFIGMP